MLLGRCADKVGLTSELSAAMTRAGRSPIWDRGVVLVQLAVAIVLKARSIADIALLEHQKSVFGMRPSDSAARRGLEGLDDRLRSLGSAAVIGQDPGRAHGGKGRRKKGTNQWYLHC